MSPIRQAAAVAGTGAARVRTALSWEPPLDALLAAVRSTPFLSAALFLITWPVISIVPHAGPDASWQAGLYIAVEGGLQFGRDFVFTYGPLGFVHSPNLYGGSLFLVAFGYMAFARLALVASLVWMARRALPLPLAVAACFVVLVVGHLNSSLVLLAFLWAFAALAPDAPRLTTKLLVFGGGFAAGFELLAKVNYGISILALCLLALTALPRRRRNLPLFGVAFGTSLLGLWLATGQEVGNLPSYLSNSLQMVSGYSAAMGIDIQPQSHEIALAAIAVGCLAIATAVVARNDRRTLRWGSVALFLLFSFFSFKQDFIRRGPEGRAEFSLLLTCAAIAIAARLPLRPGVSRARWLRFLRARRSVAAAALIAPMIVFVVWANPAPSFSAALEPDVHVTLLREDLKSLTRPAARDRDRAQAQASMRDNYGISAAILKRIGDRSIAVEPWEIGVAWAFGLNWRPLPVIQDYAVYTPALDRLNAEALSGDGPEMILRHDLRSTESWVVDSVDKRYPAWDGPAAKLALLCNYREAAAGGEWQLLEKTADRCGPVTALGTVTVESGAEATPPQPPHANEIVFAKVGGLQPGLGEEAETLLYRQPNAWVSFDAGKRWNMARTTAGDGLIVSAPRAVDFRPPFQLAPDPRSLAIGVDGAGTRPLTISFYSRSVEPRRAGIARTPRSTGDA